jgi:TolA-binding protein
MNKIPIIPLIGLLVPVLVVAPAALADAGADLKQAEGLYQAGQYAQAEQVYLTVIKEADPNRPADMEAAFHARKKLPLVYIATDRRPLAKEAVWQLLSRHAAHESLPSAVHELVEAAKPLYKLSQVRQLFQDMVMAKAGDPQAVLLKMGIAIASVYLTDDQAIDAALQDITSQHASDPRAAEVLNQVAWACRKLEQYNKALTIYEYVVDNWAAKDRAAFAQHGIVICHLGFRNPQAADEAMEALLQKYGKDRNASKLVLWAAHAYVSAGAVKRACEVYEFLIRNYPDCEELVEAQASLGIIAVQAEDTQRAEAAVQALLTQYPANEAKATALRNVANTLVWKEVAYLTKPAQEKQASYSKCLAAIAEYILANYPGGDAAMWAERDLAVVAIQSGDEAAAEASLGRLTANYAHHADTSNALLFLGEHYVRVRRDDKAEAVYQHIIKEYPNHEVAPLAKLGIGRIRIRQGNDADAERIYQEILRDYRNHLRLAEMVQQMAEGYRDRVRVAKLEQIKKAGGTSSYAMQVREQGLPEIVKNYHRRAIEKWEILINNEVAAPRDIIAMAYTFAGEAYGRIDEPKKALEYFTAVAEHYPDYQYADYAFHMAARMFEQLQAQKVITEAEALPMIVSLSQALLNQYPQSEYAPIAQKALDRLTLTEIRRKELRHAQQ